MKKGERGQKLNDKKCNDENNKFGDVYIITCSIIKFDITVLEN